MENPKFQTFKDKKEEFRFLLRAKNGEPILHSSEGYSSKQGCFVGIGSVKANAPYDFRYYRGKTANGQYYFTISASNGNILGMSEFYQTEQGRDSGIAAVKRDAPDAPTEDLT